MVKQLQEVLLFKKGYDGLKKLNNDEQNCIKVCRMFVLALQ